MNIKINIGNTDSSVVPFDLGSGFTYLAVYINIPYINWKTIFCARNANRFQLIPWKVFMINLVNSIKQFDITYLSCKQIIPLFLSKFFNSILNSKKHLPNRFTNLF